MGMHQAVRCPQCGSLTRPGLIDGSFEGLCPGCLASMAVGEAGTVPKPRKAQPIPGEAAPARPEARLGKYILSAKLGVGSAGEVWKAWDTVLGRWVALKLFHFEDSEELARFTREAETAAQLSHPGIAAIYEVGEAGGRRYLAMQYVEGMTLRKYPRRDRPLLVRLIRDAARAVAAAHAQGIIHRDLKPANLAVARHGEEPSKPHVYVLDFGLARRVAGDDKVTATGFVVGTPAYMPPEQARGQAVDARADVYALGATLYELTTGRTPFRGSSVYEILKKVEEQTPRAPRSLVRSIPRDLETIILKCLHKDPDRRYASADLLADDLDRQLHGEAILARPAGVLYRLRKRLARSKGAAVTGAGILGLLVAAAIVVPRWKAEADARKGHESTAKTHRESWERARPFLESGRSILQRMKSKMREPYSPDDMKALAEQARAQFSRALVESPGTAEPHHWTGVSFAMTGEKEPALAAFGKAIGADSLFAPAYLERVRLQIDEYEEISHWGANRADPQADRAKVLRAALESDLASIEKLSKDYSVHGYARALFAFGSEQYEKAPAGLARHLTVEVEDGEGWCWLGHSYYHLRKYPEAIASLEKAVGCNRRNRLAMHLLAISRIHGGHPADAVAGLTDMIEQDPKDPAPYRWRGDAYLQTDRIDEAIADFTCAIHLKKESPRSHDGRASARYRKGLYKEAVEDWSRAIELGYKPALVFVHRAQAWNALKEPAKAVEDYTTALQLDPTDAFSYEQRGHLRLGLRQWEGAVSDLTKAIEGAPHAGVHLSRALANQAMGYIEEARLDYDRAIRLDQNSWPAYWGRAHFREQVLRDFEGALKDYERILVLNPSSTEGLVGRGHLRRARRDLDGAFSDFNRACELDPDHAMAFAGRASIKSDRKDYDGAIRDYALAIKLDPKSVWSYGGLAAARHGSGDCEGALRDYEHAISLDRKQAWLFKGRGDVWMSLERYEEAVSSYTEAVSLEPKAWQWRFARGLGRHQIKDFENSIGDFKEVIRLNPGYNAAHYNIACAHAIQDHKQEALDWLEQAVQAGFNHVSQLTDDPDLESIRREERFKRLLQQLKAK